MSRKLLEGLWQSEKLRILEAVPKKRTLSVLLSQPVLELVNGDKSAVKSSDLEFLTQLLPSSLYKELELPFLFQKNKGHYLLLRAGKLEKWVVEKILGLVNTSPFLLEVFHPRPSYYSYHFRRVQSKIPTLVFLTYLISPTR